ncbi:MAG: acyl-protein synthetase, partial [Lachnospiraceae bacterium]|nr:acyl-protein synthetase [Lachnospiraceae bacterium]
MLEYAKLLEYEPYSMDRREKTRVMTQRLLELTEHHRSRCEDYRRILDGLGYDASKVKDYYDIPMMPVRLFKERRMSSIPDEEVFKTMTSSGTTGQQVSKIFLDEQTASNQQLTLARIVTDYTGQSRMPMIIIDCPSVIRNRAMFSARGAGILGFSMFGSRRIYALDDDMKLNLEGIREFLEKYKGQKILLFGFTFMIWQYFYKELCRLDEPLDLSGGILIHGGGWKKLQNEAVSKAEFKQRLKDVCGIEHVMDYYGMVEQTGCIYMECECGHLHASIYSDIIPRRMSDFSPCDVGEKGVLQVVSMLPESYPGHSILTEDEGVLLGED